MTVEEIAERLQGLARRRFELPSGKAAVLMSLVQRRSGLQFLLTLRTQTVATHKGQVSFPGGFREGSEALQTTALRETEEETGVGADHVRVLGVFHDYLTASGQAVVRPFVGQLIGNWQLAPNPGEVESAFEAPLDFFAETKPRLEHRQRPGKIIPIYFWEYRGFTVWGLTAAMIKDFLDTMEIRRW